MAGIEDDVPFLGRRRPEQLEERPLRRGTPMVWSQVRRTLPQAWQDEWEAKIARDIERSLASMRWLPGDGRSTG